MKSHSVKLGLFVLVCVLFVFGVAFFSCRRSYATQAVTYYHPYRNRRVPANLFQTWHSKTLPPKMKETVEKLKTGNPELRHFLFDTDQMHDFVQTHFGARVSRAFLKLKPASYRSDLWRSCVLYVHGGIYFDIKYQTRGDFKLVSLLDKPHLADDVQEGDIAPAVMVCHPKTPLLRRIVNQIVVNTENNFYGKNCLHPTGPSLIKDLITQLERAVMVDMRYRENPRRYEWNGKVVLDEYPEYRDELSTNGDSYAVAWEKRQIYNEDS